MITNINEEINRLFERRKLIPYTLTLDIGDMISWSDRVSKKHSLNSVNFEKYVKELFWGLASIQISLGYTLFALNNVQYPNGCKGHTFDEKNIPNIEISDIHYWHHFHNTWESIYRFWERTVSVLETRLTPDIKGNYYFDSYVNLLFKDSKFLHHDEVSQLKKYLKSWNRIAQMRNRISHESTNPCAYFSLEPEHTEFVHYTGKRFFKIHYSLPNLKQETETVINSYKKSYELLNSVRSVCEAEIQPNN